MARNADLRFILIRVMPDKLSELHLVTAVRNGYGMSAY